MKMSITPEDFVQMKNTTRCLIECIFAREESFKRNVIKGGWSWSKENYEVNRVHFSSCAVRVEVRFDDYTTTDVVLSLGEVYSWYEDEFEKENNL